jgi:hypothetical protein
MRIGQTVVVGLIVDVLTGMYVILMIPMFVMIVHAHNVQDGDVAQ